MCHFCLQYPSHKCFDPWNFECLLFLLQSWAFASSLTMFKLAWKTGPVLALVMPKHYSDLSSLHIDNWHYFHQHHTAIFVPASGGKMD